MDLKLKLWIRDIAERLCEGSNKVDNLKITLEGDFLRVQMKEFSTELTLSGVYDTAIKDNIDPDDLRKYMIDEIGKNLRKKAIESGIDELVDILKQM